MQVVLYRAQVNSKAKSINKINATWYFLYAMLATLISLNHLHIPVLDTLAVIIAFGMVIFSPMKYELCMFALCFVIGYSKVFFNTFVLGTISITLFENWLSLLIILKYVLINSRNIKFSAGDIVVIFTIIYGAFCVYIGDHRIKPVINFAAGTLAALALIDELNEKQLYETFMWSLFICLCAELIYGIINGNQINIYGWRKLQFSGMYDPNNCALHFSAFYALATMINPNGLNRTFERIVNVVIPIIIISTLSFSGICLITGLMIIKLYTRTPSTGKTLLVLFFVILAFLTFCNFGVIQNAMVNSNIKLISGLGQRLESMLEALIQGDYNKATTGRTNLTLAYISHYKQSGFAAKMLGDFSAATSLKNVWGSSHNFYIDWLISYGILGIILLFAGIIARLYEFVKKHEYKRLIIAVLFMIVMFSRSVSLSSFMLYLYL